MTTDQRRTVVPLLVLALAALSLAPTATAHDAQSVAADQPPTGDAVSNLWILGAAMNLVMLVTFAAIATFLWRAIIDGGQLTSNPLLTGMALIFTTCSIGHALHLEHTLLPIYMPLLGIGDVYHAVTFGHWARVAMSDPALVAMDISSAAAAVWYLTTRHRHGELFEGAELAEDLRVKEEEARWMHDSVVQTCARALMHVDLGEDEEAIEAIEESIDEAKTIVDQFLEDGALEPGEASLRLPSTPKPRDGDERISG